MFSNMAVCILLAWMWLVICITVTTAETHYPPTLFIFTHFLGKILLLQEFITIQTTCVSIADNKTINFKYSIVKIWLIWTKKSVELTWLTILLLFIVVSQWNNQVPQISIFYHIFSEIQKHILQFYRHFLHIVYWSKESGFGIKLF